MIAGLLNRDAGEVTVAGEPMSPHAVRAKSAIGYVPQDLAELAGTVIAGEALGRVLIACVQALVIILGSALLFGVRWGQPAGVAAVVILYACAGAGAGTLVGTLFRNESQAAGISLLLGLGLGALGGCMVPLEVFPPTMKRIAHFTPQAWGNDAFDKLVGHGASITGILPQLGVLALFAAVLLSLAAWRLRRVLAA
jgi:ABC-2 type transport system permease protein